MKRQVLIIVDYRSQFYSSTKKRGASLDVNKIREYLIAKNYDVSVKHFVDIDFTTSINKGTYVLYQSSEDEGLFYRSYIEDVMLGLSLKGAVLIPDYFKFRAHHNKVFMEILRKIVGGIIRCPFSKFYGTYEEFIEDFKPSTFPVILKSAAGSRGNSVFLARTQKETNRYARKLSRTPSMFNLKLKIRNYFDKQGFLPISDFRRKFIVQEFIPNIPGDYKVLVYGKKFFILYRHNRCGDFRASGTKKYDFITEAPEHILNFAEKVFTSFHVPYISLDIGFDGNNCYLFEFQFIQFGQRAIEKSPHYFEKKLSNWTLVKAESSPEFEVATSLDYFIENQNKTNLDGIT